MCVAWVEEGKFVRYLWEVQRGPSGVESLERGLEL